MGRTIMGGISNMGNSLVKGLVYRNIKILRSVRAWCLGGTMGIMGKIIQSTKGEEGIFIGLG